MTKQEVIQRVINLQDAIEKYQYITPNIAIGILSRINRIISEIDEYLKFLEGYMIENKDVL